MQREGSRFDEGLVFADTLQAIMYLGHRVGEDEEERQHHGEEDPHVEGTAPALDLPLAELLRFLRRENVRAMNLDDTLVLGTHVVRVDLQQRARMCVVRACNCDARLFIQVHLERLTRYCPIRHGDLVRPRRVLHLKSDEKALFKVGSSDESDTFKLDVDHLTIFEKSRCKMSFSQEMQELMGGENVEVPEMFPVPIEMEDGNNANNNGDNVVDRAEDNVDVVDVETDDEDEEEEDEEDDEEEQQQPQAPAAPGGGRQPDDEDDIQFAAPAPILDADAAPAAPVDPAAAAAAAAAAPAPALDANGMPIPKPPHPRYVGFKEVSKAALAPSKCARM